MSRELRLKFYITVFSIMFYGYNKMFNILVFMLIIKQQMNNCEDQI